MKLRHLWFVALAPLCACETDNDTQVAAEAVLQLSAVNVAAVTNVLLESAECGLSSAAVVATQEVTGMPGGFGRATWQIRECVLDMTTPRVLTDCDQVATTVSGRVTVNGSVTLEGQLTGDPGNPVLPLDPQALTVRLSEVRFRDLKVARSGAAGTLTFRQGSFAATVQPRLARSAAIGACSVPTPNVSISGLRLSESELFLEGDGQSSYVFVATSSATAQLGKGETRENTVGGSISLFGIPVEVPERALDPGYDAAAFTASFACTDGLALPLSYECGRATSDDIVDGLARLSIQSVASVASLVAKDTSCGLASANARAAAQLEPSADGTGVLTLRATDCRITLPATGMTVTDCRGNTTTLEGAVTVSATQVVRGRITQRADNPLLPLVSTPATLTLDRIRWEGFSVRTGTSGPALVLVEGESSAVVEPALARATDGVCRIETPIARLTDVQHTDLLARLERDGEQITLELASGSLEAVNGALGADENTLSGELRFEGETRTTTIPTVSGAGLVPDYSRTTFDAGWTCAPELSPTDRFTCDSLGAAPEGIARLTPEILAAVVQLLEADAQCGLASAAARASSVPQGMLGAEGSIVTTLPAPCTIEVPTRRVLGQDCQGHATYVQGTVTVEGRRTLSGFLTGSMTEPLLPTTRYASRYELALTLSGFTVSTDDATRPTLTSNGRLSGVVLPQLALDRTVGACTLPTRIAELSAMTWSDAQVTVTAPEATLSLRVQTSSLSADVGPSRGGENRIRGDITVESSTRAVSAALQPGYDQAAFLATFTCDPDLLVVPADEACSFRTVLGNAAARLLVRHTAVVTNQILADNRCGFSSLPVLSAPRQVMGDPGMPGLIVHGVNECTITRSGATADQPVSDDCLREQVFLSGSATVTAERTTQGLRSQQGMCPACIPIVVPLTRQAVTVALQDIDFVGSRSFSRRADEAAVEAAITIVSGSVAGTLAPVLGESSTNAGVFSVGTPIADVTLQAQDLQLLLELGGRNFRVSVPSANLTARSGRFGGDGNRIAGTLVVDGRMITLPTGPLIADYQQSTFDLSYACTPGLREPVPAN